jgi:hypothetical protein
VHGVEYTDSTNKKDKYVIHSVGFEDGDSEESRVEIIMGNKESKDSTKREDSVEMSDNKVGIM